MKIVIDTDDIWHVCDKVFVTVLVVAIILCILYPFAMLIDNNYDQRMCEVGTSIQNIDVNSCFANDDLYRINLGHDISCRCFPIDMTTHYEFKVK